MALRFCDLGLSIAGSWLEERIAQRLEQGYLVDPKVTVKVTSYRPFYIIGEVARPGGYEYRNGMTAIEAVALAGGDGGRAQQDAVIKRGGVNAEGVSVPPSTRILPGDVIEVPERYF